MDYEKISKYFSGEMTSKEKEVFLSDLNKQDQLEDVIHLKNVWSFAQMKDLKSDRETARKGWSSFKNKRKNEYNRAWWRVASIIVLVSCVGMGSYFLGENSRKKVPVAYHTLSVPAGQYAQLVLSDGTEIWLNSRSKLVYPDRFESNIREVQFEGEGFFKVTSDKGHPFIVKTENMDITATGTQFNISAYDDDTWFSATLVEGTIKLTSTKYGIDHSLTEDHMAIHDKLKNTLKVKSVDTDIQISWTRGEFRFKELSLEDITKRLERNFNVNFVFINNTLKQRIFTGTFYNHQSIENILRVMKTSTLKMNYSIENDTIYIK